MRRIINEKTTDGIHTFMLKDGDYCEYIVIKNGIIRSTGEGDYRGGIDWYNPEETDSEQKHLFNEHCCDAIRDLTFWDLRSLKKIYDLLEDGEVKEYCKTLREEIIEMIEL